MEFGLAVGFRFRPRDSDLLLYYLYRKITGQPLPEGVVSECDIYGPENPWEIWDRCMGIRVDDDEKDFYVFTKLKKVSQKGSRICRKIGLGKWEAENSKKIEDPTTMKPIGLMRRFRFEKSGTEHDNGWLMFEYNLDQSVLGNAINNDYVLCRIRKNEAEPQQRNECEFGAEKKRKRQEEVKQPKKRTKKQELERNETVVVLPEPQENLLRVLPVTVAPPTPQITDDEDLNCSIDIDELLELLNSEDSMPNGTGEEQFFQDIWHNDFPDVFWESAEVLASNSTLENALPLACVPPLS